jgi:ribosomal protein S18 acetylase RimI-like enzyme
MATMVRNNDNNQLRTIYVLPEYHRSGIGTMLWNAVKDFIDESKDTIVQVADYNQQAINFYEKLGFVDTGKRWKDERWKMRSGAYIPEMEMILKK